MSLRHVGGLSPMLVMRGSMVVSFGVDPDTATPRHRAKLVEAGASVRVMNRDGLEVGPTFPIPGNWWKVSGGVFFFRAPIAFSYWNGPIGWYDTLMLRVAPVGENAMYVPPSGWVAAMHFARCAFGPNLTTHVDLPELKVE